MKLQYNQDGATDTINLVDYQPSMHRLAIQKNGQTYYAKLGEVNHPEASNIKVCRNDKTFAVIKKYNPLTFDECGNTYTQYGDCVSINANVLCGRAIQSKSDYYSRSFSSSVIGTGDFTIDFWVYIASEDQLAITNPEWRLITSPRGYFDWRPSFNINSTTRNCFLTQSQNRQVVKIPDDGLLNKWFHLEQVYVHEAEQNYFFFNGELKITCSTKLGSATPLNYTACKIGGHRLAEIRISDGIARHTENFTPPTKPYEVDEYTTVLYHF